MNLVIVKDEKKTYVTKGRLNVKPFFSKLCSFLNHQKCYHYNTLIKKAGLHVSPYSS